MSTKCLQCGAQLAAGEECRSFFDRCLAQEAEPGYYAVHQLLVLSYMLQHNAYSRQGWIGARALLDQFVNDSLTPAQARQQHRSTVDSSRRSWSITKGAKLDQVDAIVWSHTIADVRLDTPEHYCADIARWATSVLADTAALIKSLPADEAEWHAP